MNGNQVSILRVILLRFRMSTQSRRVPSFFYAKRTGALPGDWDDWLNPAKHVIEES